MATQDSLPKPGQKDSLFSALNLPVFIGAALSIISVMALALLHPTPDKFFNAVQIWITDNLSWYYMLVVAIILGATIYLGFSRFGDIKLGPDHSQPDYSDTSWFAMLFSTGMGVGLMFFGIAEPMMHYLDPPAGIAETNAAAREAINITLFHWGIHGWAVYALVGLALAYFSFRMNLPLALRSALYPLIGDRIYGGWGHAMDIFAIVGTAFGIATTLGLGVMQINTGLNYVTNGAIPTTSTVQIILIIVTTMAATVSVSLGLDRGIKFLSMLNLILAVLLLFFVFFFGGKVVHLLQTFIQNLGDYITTFLSKTFNLYAYEPNKVAADGTVQGSEGWLGGWTIPYWGWWLAWSPFVGMFIARISRGRTIRNFIFGVLLIPTGFTCFWFSIFGNSGLELVMSGEGLQAGVDIVSAIEKDNSLALFEYLRSLPLTSIVSVMAVLIIAIFFITSADSGALVMDLLASKHNIGITPLWQRIFWGTITGFIAIILLYADGLGALQTATTASAFPFSLMLMLVIYGLIKALRTDYGKTVTRDKIQRYAQPTGGAGGWQKRLRNLMTYPSRGNVVKFFENSLIPAMEEVKVEIEKQGVTTRITVRSEDDIQLEVEHGDQDNFIYRVKARHYLMPDFHKRDDETIETIHDKHKYFRAEVYLDDGSKGYDIIGYSRDEIANDIIDQYTSHLYFIQNYQTETDYEVGREPDR